MKKGRISNIELGYIRENINIGYEQLALDLDRDKNSLLEFIKKRVAKGVLPEPAWLGNRFDEEKAKYDLSFRPYWKELEAQFTTDNSCYSSITGLELYLSLQTTLFLPKRYRLLT